MSWCDHFLGRLEFWHSINCVLIKPQGGVHSECAGCWVQLRYPRVGQLGRHCKQLKIF